MIIYPAIDLHQGKCVRLYQGAFDTAQQVAESPLAAAQSFARAGAKWVHVVDLDGARSGQAENGSIVAEIVRKSGLMVQLGGGIRNMRAIEEALSLGVSRVVIGSAALQNPELVRLSVQKFKGAVAVGIDAIGGMVSVSGWTEKSDTHFLEFAKKMEDTGVQTIIFTDIAKDGTLAGPNLDALEALSNEVGCRIIASGGVRNMEDVRALAALRLDGAICGKSIYQRTLDLSQAVQFSNSLV